MYNTGDEDNKARRGGRRTVQRGGESDDLGRLLGTARAVCGRQSFCSVLYGWGGGGRGPEPPTDDDERELTDDEKEITTQSKVTM